MMTRVVMAAFGLIAVAAHAATLKPLPVEAALTMRDLALHSAIALSPDGQAVAYTVERPAQNEIQAKESFFTSSGAPFMYRATDIWVSDVASGSHRVLTGEQGANWGQSWSPDGQSLAFYSDRIGAVRLWLWDSKTGELRQAGDVPIHTLHTPQWFPDGKRVLIGVQSKNAPAPVAAPSGTPLSESGGFVISRPTVTVFNSRATDAAFEGTPTNISNSSTTLAVFDTESGELRRLVEDAHPGNLLISPDGAYVAYAEETDGRKPGTHIRLMNLKLLSIADGSVRTLASDAVLGYYGLDVSWSPDGKLLAYRAGDHYASEAYLVTLDGATRPVTGQEHPLFRGKPIWDEQGRFIYLMTENQAIWEIATADGRAREVVRFPANLKGIIATSTYRDRLWRTRGGTSLVALTQEGTRSAFHEVQLGTGKIKTLFEDEKQYVLGDPVNSVTNVLASARTNQVVYVAQDAQRPPDLWAVDSGFRRHRQISRLNPAVSEVKMGERRVIEWTGKDGARYNGLMLLPSNYRKGERYPTVFFLYPIDALPFANYFGASFARPFYNLQMLATRGYAVVFVGAEARRGGEPMKERADSMLPAVDKVIELGIADPERLGVFGSSAGGYSTLALIVQSTRFKAAMAHCGPGNLLSLYGDLQDSGYSHGMTVNESTTFGMPDHPWNARDQYIRNSPWFFLDKVETPLLILQGTRDTAVTVSQANELFNGLRRLGKEVQYARYEGEEHGFTALVNAIDAAQRYIAWFDRFLKPETPSSTAVTSR